MPSAFQAPAAHPPATEAASAADPSHPPSTSPARKRQAAEDKITAGPVPAAVEVKKKARLERLSKWKDAQAAKGSLPKPQGPSGPTTDASSPSATVPGHPQTSPSTAQPHLVHGSATAADVDPSSHHGSGDCQASAGVEQPPSQLEHPPKRGSTVAPDKQQHSRTLPMDRHSQEPGTDTEGAAESSQPRAAGHEPLAPVLVPTSAPAVPDHLPLNQHDPANTADEPPANSGHPEQHPQDSQRQASGNQQQLPASCIVSSEDDPGTAVLLGPPESDSSAVVMQEQPLQHAPDLRSDYQQGAEAVGQQPLPGQHGAGSSPARPAEIGSAAHGAPWLPNDAFQQPESVMGRAPDAEHDKQLPGAVPEAPVEAADADASADVPGRLSSEAVVSKGAAQHVDEANTGPMPFSTIHDSDERPAGAGGEPVAAGLDEPGSVLPTEASTPAAEPASASQLSTAAPPAAVRPAVAVPTTDIKVAGNAIMKLTGTFKPGKLPHGNPASEAAASHGKGEGEEERSHHSRPQLDSKPRSDAAANGRSRTARDIVREEELLPGPPPLTSQKSLDARHDPGDAKASTKPADRPHHDSNGRGSPRQSRNDRPHGPESSDPHRASRGSGHHGHGSFDDRHRSHSLGSERDAALRPGKHHHRDDWPVSPRANGRGAPVANEPPSAKRPRLHQLSDQRHLSGSGSIHSDAQGTSHERQRHRSSDSKSRGSSGRGSKARDRSAVHGDDYYDDPQPGTGVDLYKSNDPGSSSFQVSQDWHGQQPQPPSDDRWGMDDGPPPRIELVKPTAGSENPPPPLTVSVPPALDAEAKKPTREMSSGELSGSPPAGKGSPDAAGKPSVFSRLSR